MSPSCTNLNYISVTSLRTSSESNMNNHGHKMLSVTAPTYTSPSGYELSTVPRPTVTGDNDVLIKVHAASINPVDVKKAAGVFKIAIKEE